MAKSNLTRVSPGVYRDAKGNLTNSAGKGILSEAPKKGADKGKKAKAPAPYKGPGLSPQENQVINQQFERDIAAGQVAEQLQPQAFAPFQQPLDWTQGPKAPVVEDVQSFAQQASDKYAQAFDQRMNPVFKQQRDDFEQDMYNRGIPVGSTLYNQQKAALDQQQQDARTQAYASGQSQAMSNAQSLFGIGNEARTRFYGEELQKRNMPFEEYTKIASSVSPFANQAYGYAQTKDLQKQQEANQRWLMQHTPRGGGGGGGSDPYQGFGSAENYWKAQDARQLAQAEAMMQLEQRYAPKDRSPSYGAQLGGGLLGVGLGILGSKYL